MKVRALAISLACFFGFVLAWRTASADPVRYHLTLDAAKATQGHQATEFGWGSHVNLSADLPLNDYLGLEMLLGGVWLSKGSAPSDRRLAPQGGAQGVSLGLGLRSYLLGYGANSDNSSNPGLWISASASGMNTNALLRAAFAGNLGYDFSVGRSFAMGPTVGYLHVLQPESALRPDDASLLVMGLHGVFGSAPEVASDRDGDGIPDQLDRCPDQPEDKDGFQDEDGCPDLDNDGDGIADAQDKCPNEAEDKDGFHDEDGCPDSDNDGDRVADAQDKCPNDPEDKDAFDDEDGCPDLDNDGDGISDAEDQCPNEPETVNGYHDEDGCPDEQDIRVVGDKIVLDDRIHFWKNSHLIRNESEPLIERVARLILSRPEYTHIEVEGHTDHRGPDSFNQPLSERRANEVMRALIKYKVQPSRLSFKGFGESQPLVEGDSEQAMWLNRRVEFRITRAPEAPKPNPPRAPGAANPAPEGTEPAAAATDPAPEAGEPAAAETTQGPKDLAPGATEPAPGTSPTEGGSEP